MDASESLSSLVGRRAWCLIRHRWCYSGAARGLLSGKLGSLVYKALSGESAGSGEMVSASMSQIKRQEDTIYNSGAQLEQDNDIREKSTHTCRMGSVT